MKEKISKYVLPFVAIIAVCSIAFFVFKNNNKAEPLTNIQEEEQSNVTIEKDANSKEFSEKTYISNIEKNITNKDYAIAKKIAEEALTFYPKSEQIINEYITILSQSNNNTEIAVYVDKLIVINPADYSYWKLKARIARIGLTASDSNKIGMIKEIYEKALLATHNNIEIISTYAVFAEDYLTKQKAIELWSLAKSVNPIGAQSYQTIIDRLSK